MNIEERILKSIRTALMHAEFYDQFWHTDTFSHIGEFEEVRLQLFEIAMRKYASSGKKDILDLGCGTGWASQLISRYGSYTGIDFSSKGIAYAQQHFSQYGTFVLASNANIKLGLPLDKKYDVIFCSEVIEHVEDHQAFVEQLRLLMQPEGLCVLTTPNGYLYAEIKKRYSQQFQPIENWLTPHRARKIFISNNFRVLHHCGLLFRNIDYGFRGKFVSHEISRIAVKLGLRKIFEKILLFTSLYQGLIVKSLQSEE
jgi:2-polyprenyl-3-methyl-5-hydroxy-6-metoxy-1,4-benzoquinol methylase